MSDTPVEQITALEQRQIDEAALMEEMQADGFKVEPRANGGFVVSAYTTKTIEAAFSNFADMVKWMADAFGEELPK